MPQVKALLPANGKPIMFVGMYPGEDEEFFGVPQTGAAGTTVFNPLLKSAGLKRSEIAIDNLFSMRPPENDLSHWLVNKKEVDINAIPEHLRAWAGIPIVSGGYLHPDFFWELERLRQNILEYKPNIMVALGAPALWALCQTNAVGANRGVIQPCLLVPDVKVLPTYNPAYVLHNWQTGLPICVVDYIKATRNMDTAPITRPRRTIYVEPSLKDLDWYYEEYLKDAVNIYWDVETTSKFGGILKCVGFSPDEHVSMVVPLLDKMKRRYAYWRTARDERKARDWMAMVLEGAKAEKTGHNGLYDVQWVLRKLAIGTRNYAHDTMLLHHAIFLELPKKLGILGSIYTNETSWKNMTRVEKFAREK
jgi:uracil-DNA glycosylase